MRVAEDFMMLLFGVVILIVIPVKLKITETGYVQRRAVERIKKQFLEAVSEENAITAEDYTALKNAYSVLSGNKDPKVSVIHLEAERGKTLGDHFYTMTDEEICDTLALNGSIPIGKGMVVFVDE